MTKARQLFTRWRCKTSMRVMGSARAAEFCFPCEEVTVAFIAACNVDTRKIAMLCIDIPNFARPLPASRSLPALTP